MSQSYGLGKTNSPSIRQRLKNQLARRDQFADRASWLADMYVRVLNWKSSLPLPGRKRIFRIRPAAVAQPLTVRPNTTDLPCLCEIFTAGEYSDYAEFCPKRVSTVLDLGGNVGMSVRFWQEKFPDVKILVVEPDEGNIAQLMKNVLAGPSPSRVETVQAFAAAAAGQAGIDRSSGEWTFHMTENSHAGEPLVPKIPVGVLIEKLAGTADQISLLKCDVEGAEAEIFADCGNWISKVISAVVETHPPYGPALLLNDLRKAGARIKSHKVIAKGQDLNLLWASLGGPDTEDHPGTRT